MTAWLVAIAIAVFSIVLWVYTYKHNLERQLVICTANIKTAIKQNRRTDAEKQIQHIFHIINTCITSNNVALAYKSVEILKLAFGEGVAGQNEVVILKNSIIAAMRQKSFSIAAYLLDAFKPLNHSNVKSSAIIKEMRLIGSIAFKEKQQFILAKSVDIVFECCNRNISVEEFRLGLSVLKILGTLAIKRKDRALFREIAVRLSPGLNKRENNQEIIEVLSTWLHSIVAKNDEELLDIMLALTDELITTLHDYQIKMLLQEWKLQAGAAGLNPTNRLGDKLAAHIVKIVSHSNNTELWAFAANSIDSIAKVVLDTGGYERALAILYPLLSAGSGLLIRELNLSKSLCCDEVRQQIVFVITKEILSFTEYWARKESTFSVGDLFLKMREWLFLVGKNNERAINKYFQLLFLYWYNTQRKQARRGMPDQIDVSLLLTAQERQHLRFL